MKLRWIIMRASCWTGVWVIERTHLWVYVRAYAVKSAEHADHQWETSTLVTTRGVRRWRRRRKETESGLLTPSGGWQTLEQTSSHTQCCQGESAGCLSFFLFVCQLACLWYWHHYFFLTFSLSLKEKQFLRWFSVLFWHQHFMLVIRSNKTADADYVAGVMDGKKRHEIGLQPVGNLKIKRILYKFDMYIYQYTLV